MATYQTPEQQRQLQYGGQNGMTQAASQGAPAPPQSGSSVSATGQLQSQPNYFTQQSGGWGGANLYSPYQPAAKQRYAGPRRPTYPKQQPQRPPQGYPGMTGAHQAPPMQPYGAWQAPGTTQLTQNYQAQMAPPPAPPSAQQQYAQYAPTQQNYTDPLSPGLRAASSEPPGRAPGLFPKPPTPPYDPANYGTGTYPSPGPNPDVWGYSQPPSGPGWTGQAGFAPTNAFPTGPNPSKATYSGMPGQAQAGGVAFDAAWYAQQNPDLAAHGITTPEALYNHYINGGMQQGRRANSATTGGEYATVQNAAPAFEGAQAMPMGANFTPQGFSGHQFTTQAPDAYQAGQVSQWGGIDQSGYEDAQLGHYMGAMANGPLAPWDVNRLKEIQKEQGSLMGTQAGDLLSQNAAGRGVLGGGATEAGQRDIRNTMNKELLSGYRDIDLAAAKENYYGKMEAANQLGTGLTGQMARGTQNYENALKGQLSQEELNQRAVQSALDTAGFQHGVARDQATADLGREEAINRYGLEGSKLQAANWATGLDALLGKLGINVDQSKVDVTKELGMEGFKVDRERLAESASQFDDDLAYRYAGLSQEDQQFMKDLGFRYTGLQANTLTDFWKSLLG